MDNNKAVRDPRMNILGLLAFSTVLSMGAILWVHFTMGLGQLITVILILAVLVFDLVAALVIMLKKN